MCVDPQNAWRVTCWHVRGMYARAADGMPRAQVERGIYACVHQHTHTASGTSLWTALPRGPTLSMRCVSTTPCCSPCGALSGSHAAFIMGRNVGLDVALVLLACLSACVQSDVRFVAACR
jgi:hypothetical protein